MGTGTELKGKRNYRGYSVPAIILFLRLTRVAPYFGFRTISVSGVTRFPLVFGSRSWFFL